ncbi:unnamed protein product, partial [Meganyctiphanes norvegica]
MFWGACQKLFLLGLLEISIYSVESHICDGLGEVPRHRLGSKTAYFNVPTENYFRRKFESETGMCKAQQVWLLTRHGTRYPTKNDMGRLMEYLPKLSQQIAENHQQGRGCLEEDDISQLASWVAPYSARDREQLQETGYDELYEIGQHWKEMFPELFSVPYSPEKFKIEFTVKNRTGQSAYHFLRGMFGEDAVGEIEMPKPYEPNFILRFYKACPRWLKEVYKNNETTYKERLLFVESQPFQAVLHAVSARLGFMHPISSRELESIYDECRYETAWWPNKSSPWCKSFAPHDFEVMEYHQDLKYYYEDSFGHPLNSQTACRTIIDLYNHFRTSVVSDEADHQGIFYFAHDKSLFKVLALMELFRPIE